VSRYRSCVWKPLNNRSSRALQKDILCWHTMVSTSMAGTWTYFNTGAGGRGVYSHGLLGGGWGVDARNGLDGVCWQAQDTNLRAASNLDGNWHVIAFETADNAARPIQPWTPKQCAKIVEVCVEANQVDGIPLLIIPDSRVGRRGVGYHRLGCDPYRVAGGELWTSVYGKDCPTDARIRQLPALVDQARIIVAGGNPPTQSDILEEFMALYDTAAEYEAGIARATQKGHTAAMLTVAPYVIQAQHGIPNSVFPKAAEWAAADPEVAAATRAAVSLEAVAALMQEGEAVLQEIEANTTPPAPPVASP
jgi:hypothetical protein